DDVRSSDNLFSLFLDPVDAVETINSNFSSFFTKRLDFPFLPVDQDMKPDICSERSIFHLLSNLKTDKACGSDGVHPIFLKLCADVVCRPISHFINLSFQQGIFPTVWKLADVCPVPKSRPVRKDQLRPISLLPIVSKICEKAVLSVYSEPLLRHYDKCQFAYRPKSSTTCALLTFHEIVINFLDDFNVGAVRVITFDMSRAFDRVPHHMLLLALSSLNIPDCNLFVNWINSYLSNRQQRVKLGNIRSSSSPVSSGVPQGSILGPLLFSIYFSSYKPSDVNSHVVKYADDITLIVPVYKAAFDDMSLTNLEIFSFENWCDIHKMCINPSKTQVLNINFGKSILKPLTVFDNVSVIKVLGLHFNEKLTWRDHFNFVIRKASSRLYVLRTLKPLLDHDKLVNIFYALMQSILDYASALFLNANVYI
ncbi:MAG: reverse transcriptase family protein, partial [Pseudomonadota bacterium]